jgi:23S rRNA pseudouridine1911/1915/1917 synthase
MVKLSSHDALDVLRQFKLSSDDNVPRHIEAIKTSHPSPSNTLITFRFAKRQFYVLFDQAAEDDVEYVMSQIKIAKNDIKGELVHNPNPEDSASYAIPFKGKDCYLFAVISDKKRLDSELFERYPETSRSTWQKYIKAGHISINGKVNTSPNQNVTEIDSISINKPDGNDFSKNELPVIYIDDNVIVINKPIGVLSHSKGAMNDEFTVADYFKRYTTYNIDTNRPGIIHRLDRDTSGIMIGARNSETATQLQKQFADRKTKKTYYAILNGIPKLSKAIIDLPINRNPSKPSTFRVDSNGKSAITKYEVIDATNKYALVKLQPQTGRTHQLRIHMNYINTPILGDKVYDKPAKRLFLHAASLEITIPNGIRQTFSAPIPVEFKEYFPDITL